MTECVTKVNHEGGLRIKVTLKDPYAMPSMQEPAVYASFKKLKIIISECI